MFKNTWFHLYLIKEFETIVLNLSNVYTCTIVRKREKTVCYKIQCIEKKDHLLTCSMNNTDSLVLDLT